VFIRVFLIICHQTDDVVNNVVQVRKHAFVFTADERLLTAVTRVE